MARRALRDDGVEVASEDDLRRFRGASLQALGLTFEELEEQAKQGSFASDRARLTWMAIADLAPTAYS